MAEPSFFREKKKIKNLQFEEEISKKILEPIFTDSHEIDDFFNCVKQPERIFTLRVNPTKISTDTLLQLIQSQNPEVDIRKGPLKNTLIMNIEGPFELKEHPKRIFVDRYAAESIMKGADLFFPGVKHPEGKVKKNDLVSLVNLGDGKIVGEGISQADAIDIRSDIDGICAITTNSLYKTPKFRNFKPNLWESGYYTDHSLIPLSAIYILMEFYKPGMRIFDLCSAPGNKTTAMSEIAYYLYKEYPNITAIERSARRVKSIETLVTRLDLKNIKIVNEDIRTYLEKNKIDASEQGDLVLFDPPCSALGKRPKLEFEFGIKHIEESAKYQKMLLKDAVQYVKRGGILMYNTCTLSIQENEMVCKELIEKHHFTPLKIEIPDYFTKKYKISRGIPIEGMATYSDNFIRFYVGKELGESYFIGLFKKA